MRFTTAVASALRRYASFTGRARRSEYWWFTLFTILVVVAASAVDGALTGSWFEGYGVVGALATVALALPTVAVSVRRLHDIDRRGWWTLLTFVPVVGWIVLFVFDVTPGTDGPNRFGPSPRPLPAPPSGGRDGDREPAL